MSIKLPTKTFKDYYSDPAYKQRHLEYIKQKVPCKCGVITARNNMSTHKKTKKHQKLIKQAEKHQRLIKKAEIHQKLIKTKQFQELQDALENLKIQTKKLLKKINNIKY
jgi:hypothetical protein